MTTQHSASHSLQGMVFALLRVLSLLVLLATASSAWSQCIAPAPYLPSDPCYINVTTADPFCCNTTWDSVCQGAYDACNPSGGSTDCLNTSSFGSAAAPSDATLVTISTCNYQTEYATVTGIVAGQNYTAGSSCGGYITVRSGAFNGPVVAAGNAPLNFTASVSGTYFFHYNTNAACGTATACCITTIACVSCSGGGGGPSGGSCAPGVGGAPFAGSGVVNVQPIGSAAGGACNLLINFYDSWGDGWNGAYISVLIDGVLFGDYTINTGSFGSLNVPLSQGETVTLTYVPGFFEDEVSFEVFLDGLYVYGDGPFPTTGLIYSASCANANGGSSLPVVNTPQELITEVFLGECLTASNVTYTGSNSAIGTFTNGWAIGIESGIVLTSGTATLAAGPNNSGGAGSNNLTPGHPLLTSLAGMTTFDASVFTFTFVPQTDQVTFTYVFASEEYPEFVCTSYNDVFGFFVSGPGYAPNTNIAIIPGSSLPVAIDNVNGGLGCPINYPAFYVDNTSGTSVQYDGFTLPLTACVNTVPCETYTITIAIADAGDGVLDSAVFLAAESFTAGTELEIVASVDQDLANVSSGTNCDMNGFFVFALEEPSTDPVTLVYNVNVTGDAAVDPIPLSVTFQPGETLVAVPVTSVAAGTSLTTVTLTMNSADNPGLGCSCTQTELSSTLFICDQLLLLPVTWLAFEAKNINDQREVLCEWITASEQNNDFFTVERSVDGQVWIELGTVAGSGNTSEPTNYQFIDRSPAPGVSYYRIRQTDYDGQFDYSETRAVERRSSTPLEAFPNPGNGVFKLSGYHDGDLGVYDLSGRRVPFTLSMSGELRLVNPAAGSYIVELLRDNGEAERLRIVVQ